MLRTPQSLLNPTDATHHKKTMAHLPTAILLDIFCRLSLVTIVECKSVCKEWYELLTDSIFVDEYSRYRSSTTLFVSQHKKVSDDENSTEYFPFILEILENGECISTPIVRKFLSIGYVGNYTIDFCNGLVCTLERVFSRNGYLEDRVYVRKYASGEIIFELPKQKTIQGLEYYFGFSQQTKSFKVLRNVVGKKKIDYFAKIEATYIFTVGVDDSWRRIPHPLTLTDDLYNRTKVICNGAFHWLVCCGKSIWISAFDIERETYRRIEYPKTSEPHLTWENLTVVNDHLCLFHYNFTSFREWSFWTMKEYGVTESWTKYTIQSQWLPDEVKSLNWFRPFATLKNGDMLFTSANKYLFSWNPEEERCSLLKDFDGQVGIRDVSTSCLRCNFCKELFMKGD